MLARHHVRCSRGSECDGFCRGMPMCHVLQPRLMRAQRLQSTQRPEPPRMHTLLDPAAMHPAPKFPLCSHLSHRFGHPQMLISLPPPPHLSCHYRLVATPHRAIVFCCLSPFVVRVSLRTSGISIELLMKAATRLPTTVQITCSTCAGTCLVVS